MKYTQYQVQRVIPIALSDAIQQLDNPEYKVNTNFVNAQDTKVYLAERKHFEKRYTPKV